MVELIETEFAAYWLQERLHSSEQIETILAQHLQSGLTVIVTLLPTSYIHQIQFDAQFHALLSDVAICQHERIAPVLDFGIEAGTPYIVRPWYPGGSLGQRLQVAGKLTVEEAIMRLMDVSEALEAAHAAGFVHQGLHPDILLRDENDALLLSHLGIGEIIFHLSGITTPMLPYTAPEAFLRAPSTPANDVYALGVLAYQMLTGKLPFEGVTRTQFLRGHLNKAIDMPDEAAQGLPRAIFEVLKIAMAKLPRARYKTAGDMTDALAKAAFSEKHTYVATGMRSAAKEAGQQDSTQRASVRWIGNTSVTGNLNLGQIYVEAIMKEAQNPVEAATIYRRIIQMWPHFAQGEVTERLHRLEQTLGVKQIPTLLEEARHHAARCHWSDVERFTREILSYNAEHQEARSLNATAVQQTTIEAHYHAAEIAAHQGHWNAALFLLQELHGISPRFADSAGLLVITEHVADYVHQTTEFQAHDEQVLCLNFSPDGLMLATGSTDRCVRLWRLADQGQLMCLDDHKNWVCGLLFADQGRLVYVATWDGDVKIWNAADGKFRGMLAGQANQLRGMVYTEYPRPMLAAASGYFLTLWEVPEGGRTLILRETDREPITAAAYSPDGTLLIAGTNHGYLRVRSMDQLEGELVINRRIAETPVYAVAASADQRWLAGGLRDGSIVVLDYTSGMAVSRMRGHEGAVRDICFSADGSMLATAGHDGKIVLWRASDGERLRLLGEHPGGAYGVRFSPDGRMLASAGHDGMVKLWALL